MEFQNVFIASAVRTPITTFRSSFSPLSAVDLGVLVAQEAIKRGEIKCEDVEEVIVGCVLAAGLGQNIARQIAIKSGIPTSVQCSTINKVCSSGMKAIVLGAQAIDLGYREVVLTVGTESMSNVPFYLARGEAVFGNVQLVDGMQLDGLTDAFEQHTMGWCAEKTAKDYGFSREDQDGYALSSYQKAEDAWKNGDFKNEVLPVTVPAQKGEPVLVAEDQEYKRLIPSKMPKLKAAFLHDGTGTITAGNASSISDGAAAIVLGSLSALRSYKGRYIARLVAFAEAGVDSVDFTTAPAIAVRKLLSVVKFVDIDSIALWEINEAFSLTPLVFIKDLGLDPKRVNIHGGAVALGHPIGASGSRIIVSLLHALQYDQFGVAVICNGGGEATAILVKKF